MALDSAAAPAAATSRADALIATYPSAAAYRTQLIASYQDDLIHIFTAITANAVVLPSGTPALSAPAGGGAVTGQGKIT